MLQPMETQEFLTSVGNIIRAHRKALGLSQERLAELANLHPTYISEIERGKVNASIYCFQTIAHALGLEFADFLLLPKTTADRVFEQDLSTVFNQIRQLAPPRKELVLSALRGMLVGIS
jgi:transcriptional regulator with XRE-family HTH domain